MTLRNYLILCAAGSLVTVLAMMLIPGVADTFESVLLLFLSTNAN